MKKIPTPKRVIEIRNKRRSRLLRFFILIFILILTILGASVYFSFDKRISLSTIVVTGNSIVSKKDIINIVKKDLSGKYYLLYNKANYFIYPEKKILKDLKTSFPRIKEISITHKDLDTIILEIKERKGSYLYCGDNIPEIISDVGENCYFINNDGYIFDKAPYFSGNVYFKFYKKIKNQINPLNQNIFDLDSFHSLIRFIDNIKKLGFKPISLVLNENDVYNMYLSYKINNSSPKIIFKKDNNLNDIFSNLSTAMSKKEFADEIYSKYSTLLYIDLRFKNKVLYKFK